MLELQSDSPTPGESPCDVCRWWTWTVMPVSGTRSHDSRTAFRRNGGVRQRRTFHLTHDVMRKAEGAVAYPRDASSQSGRAGGSFAEASGFTAAGLFHIHFGLRSDDQSWFVFVLLIQKLESGWQVQVEDGPQVTLGADGDGAPLYDALYTAGSPQGFCSRASWAPFHDRPRGAEDAGAHPSNGSADTGPY